MVALRRWNKLEHLKKIYSYINSALPKFLKHCFINCKQSESYQVDKQQARHTDSTTMMLQIDFAEKHTCNAQDEVQSAHSKQVQVILYTSVAWFSNSILSHVIVSDNLKHDKYGVVVFVTEILKHKPGIQLLKVWPDRPNSQFKNKYVMGALGMLSERHNVTIIWNFSATSHGKGSVDGIGATLK